MHLRPRYLESYLDEPMSKDPDEDELQGALWTCSILSEAISNAIFTSVINNKNEQDLHAIWTDIKTIYASDLGNNDLDPLLGTRHRLAGTAGTRRAPAGRCRLDFGELVSPVLYAKYVKKGTKYRRYPPQVPLVPARRCRVWYLVPALGKKSTRYPGANRTRVQIVIPYSDLLLSVFQVWNNYITEMEESLVEFSSLGLKVPDVLVGCGIVGKITKRRPILMQALFANLKALAKPKEIIAKLRDIGRHETATKRKYVKDPEPTSTALATGTSRRPPKKSNHLITRDLGKAARDVRGAR
ncbi:hypothetical protein PTTG_27966 [Puccinia triticina 1-1 BBBD Race 1]|uniref:Uncharacterized protein n=1 Tax=Puccinia triticina (isolate 1-1 / race 1 (BBBD)) TaxID=630390 RepID=A0A180GF71_PUCT1|nr:hypothetical protein PTTG_27966 [Puccinia triticina 1-1 BBBD Race 1]